MERVVKLSAPLLQVNSSLVISTPVEPISEAGGIVAAVIIVIASIATLGYLMWLGLRHIKRKEIELDRLKKEDV